MVGRCGSGRRISTRPPHDKRAARGAGTPPAPSSRRPAAAPTSPFFRSASCRIVRSRLRSATRPLSLRFSSRSCRSSRSSGMPSPAYCFFHRKKLAWLTPDLRQMSSTGVPASACRSAIVICSSVNLLFRICPSLRPSRGALGRTSTYLENESPPGPKNREPTRRSTLTSDQQSGKFPREGLPSNGGDFERAGAASDPGLRRSWPTHGRGVARLCQSSAREIARKSSMVSNSR